MFSATTNTINNISPAGSFIGSAYPSSTNKGIFDNSTVSGFFLDAKKGFLMCYNAVFN